MLADEANDKDVAHWKEEAEKNANKDLDKWQSIVNSGTDSIWNSLWLHHGHIVGDHAQMHLQLEDLQSQILLACNNMKLFVPVLGKAVDTIHYLGNDSSNALKGASLKGVVKLMHGKRDNKVWWAMYNSAW